MSLGVTQLVGFGAGGSSTTPPTYQSKGTVGESTTSPVAPTYPASIAANDLLVVAVCIAHSTSTPTCTTPSGYTLINEAAESSGTDRHSLHVYYKWAAGTESGTLSITIGGLGGANVCAIAQIWRISGVNTSSAYESDSISAEWTTTYDPCLGSGAYWDTVSITPTDTRLLVLVSGFDNDTTTLGTPTGGWTSTTKDSTTLGFDASIELFYLQTATPYSSQNLSTGGGAGSSAAGYTLGMAVKGS
jgi:hypothetical protein